MATLESRLLALATAIGTDIGALAIPTASVVDSGTVSGSHTLTNAVASPSEVVENLIMTGDTSITLGSFPAGISSITCIISGDYVLTLPGSILWSNGEPPAHDGSVGPTIFTLTSVDSGSNVLGFRGGEKFS
jgi:hypothetical protein